MTNNEKRYFVHPSSYIDDPCEIGEGTSIWHFSHVCAGATLGEYCKIGQNVLIGPDVRVGSNVKIQNNVSVYTGVVLEDDVFCGPSMVFTNVDIPRSAIPRNRPSDFKETRVKKGATIGANATIVCGNTIGQYAFIGAGAVVTRDVPDYGLVYGNPARQHGYACECGMKLRQKEGENPIGYHCDCGRHYALEGSRLRPFPPGAEGKP